MEKIAAEIQDGYVEEDVLESEVADWLEKRRDKVTRKIAPFPVKALLVGLASPLGLGSALGMNVGPTAASKTDQMRVASCLKRLGFRRVWRRINGSPQRVWIEKKR
jgi:hypothetical protein